MHIQRVGIFCDFCTLLKGFGEVFGTVVSTHVRVAGEGNKDVRFF